MTKPIIMIDFGGVYFRNSTIPTAKKFSKKWGLSQKKIINALVGHNWTEYAEGGCDGKDYWNYVSDKLNISEKQTKQIRRAWYSFATPQNGMVNLVRRLKKKYKIAVLSSITMEWIEFLEKKYKISNRFHDHHYSCDHRIDKPDARFFESAMRKMKAKPENCIVIDDNKTFIDAVKKIGAKTILFKNAKQLELELKKIGVEV
ncbi:MAG: HAD-IA family hydrolase [Candidatus Aenigmatarchaeota archaeon]